MEKYKHLYTTYTTTTTMMINEVNKMKVTCKKCGHKWDTQSRMINATCPSCGTKNKIRDIPTKHD